LVIAPYADDGAPLLSIPPKKTRQARESRLTSDFFSQSSVVAIQSNGAYDQSKQVKSEP
jgi:hypothetical protein